MSLPSPYTSAQDGMPIGATLLLGVDAPEPAPQPEAAGPDDDQRGE